MALEVYYPQDIRNALLAAEQSHTAALLAAGGEGSDLVRGFQMGYRAALTTIALAFGLIRPSGEQERGKSSDMWTFLFLGLGE